ncbi:unnamed protein product [Euphydryas editha]|uniref:Secreted protein n=1 Tax=Euphydryas editha TaxID=104508 RepID=A0AAU9VBA0_EUPED|nr:unnamed protein product [Euphydryas editha]
MLTLVFAVWSAARALGWSFEAAATSPENEEGPVLPRLRSARASSDLSTLSTTTTSSSQTSSGDYSKRSTHRYNATLLKDTQLLLTYRYI